MKTTEHVVRVIKRYGVVETKKIGKNLSDSDVLKETGDIVESYRFDCDVVAIKLYKNTFTTEEVDISFI